MAALAVFASSGCSVREDGLAASDEDAARPSTGTSLPDSGRERDARRPSPPPEATLDASSGEDDRQVDAAGPPAGEGDLLDGGAPAPAPGDAAPAAPAPVDAAPGAPAPFDAAASPAPDAGPDAGPSAPSGYCQAVPFLGAAPVVDGRLEAGLTLEPIAPLGWSGAQPLPEGQRASYAVAWRPQGLYVYVRVWDPDLRPNATLYCGDGVELYVDHDGIIAASGSYDERGARQLVAAAPRPREASAKSGAIYRDAASVGSWSSDFGTFAADGGYALEAFLKASDLGLASWNLAAGGSIGFDLAHNVSRGPGQPVECGERLGQYFLQLSSPPRPNVPSQPYANANAFCRPRLLERGSEPPPSR